MAKEPQELTDVEVVALSKACGETRVSKARANIVSDTTHPIDFTVRVTGTVSRGVAILDTTKQVTDKLSLDYDKIHAAALKKLGIKLIDYDLAYRAAVEAAEKKLVKEQAAVKPRSVPVKGREGDITASVDVAKL